MNWKPLIQGVGLITECGTLSYISAELAVYMGMLIGTIMLTCIMQGFSNPGRKPGNPRRRRNIIRQRPFLPLA